MRNVTALLIVFLTSSAQANRFIAARTVLGSTTVSVTRNVSGTFDRDRTADLGRTGTGRVQVILAANVPGGVRAIVETTKSRDLFPKKTVEARISHRRNAGYERITQSGKNVVVQSVASVEGKLVTTSTPFTGRNAIHQAINFANNRLSDQLE